MGEEEEEELSSVVLSSVVIDEEAEEEPGVEAVELQRERVRGSLLVEAMAKVDANDEEEEAVGRSAVRKEVRAMEAMFDATSVMSYVRHSL